jgi:hypothetical protein
MFTSQKQVLESFVRIRAFIEAHPTSGPLTYRGAREMFDGALQQLRLHAATQVSGRALGRAAQRQQAELVAQLRDRYMRPIVTVARAQIAPGSDVRLPAALRLPKVSIGVTRMLQCCDGMISVARPFEAVLIEQGLPADILVQFARARDELAASCARRATFTSSHIAARAGIRVELHRARLAVDRLDAVVRVAFAGDEMVLATWRTVKRVHQLPGGAGNRAATGDEAPALTLERAAA